jgi:hypothetical protein
MNHGCLTSCSDGFARELRAAEKVSLARAVRAITVGLAGRLTGLGPQAWTRYEEGILDVAEVRELQLALLRINSVLATEIDAWMSEAVASALDHTAGLGDVASVTNLERASVHRRWGRFGSAGTRIALVISQPWPDCPLAAASNRQGLYEQDRRWWRVSSAVRRSAHHAIVVVDRVVTRIYELEPEGWRCDSGGIRWEFRAVGAAPLPPARVDAAVEGGALPVRLGDPYAARLDRGCVACYFPDA